ncbi:MAG: molybdopterin-guanine dinucleotide biosynthesis protein MobA [Chloroflexota bacterium]|nr:MAG: molybdopterin-guanine dinucleotide biosynthesis protein MobA [Chloroflexota bacterium]
MSEKLIRIRSVEVLNNYRVRLGFTDKTQKEIDLEPYLHGPIFEPIRKDPLMFRSVKVDQRMGTIVWDNGADIDPDVLYLGLKPAWMEEELAPVEQNAA